MKLRALLLTSALALCVTPAFAGSNPGWYLGLGVGYDQLEPVHGTTNIQPSTNLSLDYSGDAIYVGAAGYRFTSGLRIEVELGYDAHDANKANSQGSRPSSSRS